MYLAFVTKLLELFMTPKTVLLYKTTSCLHHVKGISHRMSLKSVTLSGRNWLQKNIPGVTPSV